MNVEIFLFVFLFKDLFLEVFLEWLNELYYTKFPATMILLKIAAILGAILGWNAYLSSNENSGAEDY